MFKTVVVIPVYLKPSLEKEMHECLGRSWNIVGMVTEKLLRN